MDSKSKKSNSGFVVSGDFKSFLRAIIALLVAVMLVFGSTFAWIEGSKNAGTAGDECTVTAGAGLQFLGFNSGDISEDNVLTLPNNVKYTDCSSVDGRNFYFPTTGSISTTTTSTTNNLVFRKGVEADQNSKYLTKDFIIKSLEAEGTTGSTSIYIGSASSFSVTGATNNTALPFRISLNFNDGSAPILFCPGVVKPSPEKETASAVSAINESGVAITQTSSALSIANYYYGLTPVYRLPYGESRRVTVSVWLEGTDTNCREDLAGAKIEMNLNLTTEDSNMRPVTFVDYSPSTWVKNGNATMYVVDKITGAYYKMTKASDGKTYTTSIPNSVDDVYFQRSVASEFNPDSSDDFNTWSVTDTDSLSSSSTYYAIGRGIGPEGDTSGSYDGANYGYWVNSECTGVVTIEYTDTNSTIAGSASNYPLIYIYGSSLYGSGDGNILCNKAWAGFRMDKVSATDNVYTITIPAENGINYIINDGKTDETSKRKLGSLSGLSQNQNTTIKISY